MGFFALERVNYPQFNICIGFWCSALIMNACSFFSVLTEEMSCINNMFTCLLPYMEISNLSSCLSGAHRAASCRRASRTSRWIWNMLCIHVLWVLKPLLPTHPHQTALLLLMYRLLDFFFITALMPLQALFCTFIIPWHRTEVHASLLDMPADVNFN